MGNQHSTPPTDDPPYSKGGLPHGIAWNPGIPYCSSDEASECVRKRMPFENNEACNSWWDSTLVIAWVTLGLLLLVAFIRWHRLRRKVANIDSTPLPRGLLGAKSQRARETLGRYIAHGAAYPGFGNPIQDMPL
ncbi:hypothetical protein EDD85DRAFT_932794 [Armillaria nabsnona]|nr:hypothetical protein EDD85DRAFT_932794 [Armillaria nabsnona]